MQYETLAEVLSPVRFVNNQDLQPLDLILLECGSAESFARKGTSANRAQSLL